MSVLLDWSFIKYSWFAPAYIGRAIRDDLGPRYYGQDPSAEAAIRRLTGVVTLLAEWAKDSPGYTAAPPSGRSPVLR